MSRVTTRLRNSAAQRSPCSMARRKTPHWTSWAMNGLAPGFTAAAGVESARMSVSHTGSSTRTASALRTRYQAAVPNPERSGAEGGGSMPGPASTTPGSRGSGSASSSTSVAIVHPAVEEQELDQGHDERHAEQADRHHRPLPQQVGGLALEDLVDERLGVAVRTAAADQLDLGERLQREHHQHHDEEQQHR